MSVATGNPVFETVGGDVSAATVTPTGGTTAGSLADLAAQVQSNKTTADAANANSAQAIQTANASSAAVSGAVATANAAIPASQKNTANGVVGLDGNSNVALPGTLTVSSDSFFHGTQNYGVAKSGHVAQKFFSSDSTATGSSPDAVWDYYHGTGNNDSLVYLTCASLSPASDNKMPFGGPSNRWSTVYAGTGTISTSDATLKSDAKDLSDVSDPEVAALLKVGKALSLNVFTFIGGGRRHTGTIAQNVASAFKAEGLDAASYGVWGEDEVTETVRNDDGSLTIKPVLNADGTPKTIQSVRYDELFALVLASMRADIVALSSKNADAS